MFNAGFYPSNIVVLCQPSKSEKSKSPVSFSGAQSGCKKIWQWLVSETAFDRSTFILIIDFHICQISQPKRAFLNTFYQHKDIFSQFLPKLLDFPVSAFSRIWIL